MNAEVLNLEGKPLHFIKAGSGSVRLLFLHGLCGNKELWSQQIDELSKEGFEAVALDFPAHGQSYFVEASSLVEACTSATKTLLQNLDHKTTVLVGHSVGGWIVNELLEMPDLVHAAAFVDSPYLASQDECESYIEWGRQIAKAEDPKAFVKSWFEGLLTQNCLEAHKEHVVQGALNFPSQCLADFMTSVRISPKRKAQASIGIFEGAQYFPPGNKLSWNHRFTADHKWLYPGPGHFFFLEDPEPFNEALREFLRLLGL